MARFVLVGGVNTATFYGGYLLLHPWMPYFAAYTLAFLLSMTGSFFLNAHFTYRTRPTWRKFLFFPLTQATNYGVQSAGLVALVGWCGLQTRIAPLLAAVLAIPFTYVVSRRVLVPRGGTPGREPPPGGEPSPGAAVTAPGGAPPPPGPAPPPAP
ncbi:GtrA family protein [Streptomyces sp. NPDC003077]|uniref:GtrA family protein n=1 Tax=Streptomyces sp. NPDC003077 TaxID=3154443 RepID=UPI0033B160F4